MSPATSAASGSSSRSDDFSSSGMTIPTGGSLAIASAGDHKVRAQRRQVRRSWGIWLLVELVRTNDLVLISVIEALLRHEQISFFVADQHMSAVEGSLGFLPRRILVDSDEADRARRLLGQAGLAGEL